MDFGCEDILLKRLIDFSNSTHLVTRIRDFLRLLFTLFTNIRDQHFSLRRTSLLKNTDPGVKWPTWSTKSVSFRTLSMLPHSRFREQQTLWGSRTDSILCELQRSTESLTVGVIAESRVKEDAGLLLRLLGYVNSHVQVLNPLPHLHLRAEIPNTDRMQWVG